MSKTDVQNEILAPMQRLYLPPRDFDEAMQKSVLEEYADALKNFDAVDLKTAWGVVRNEHKTRAWPVIGQFYLAASRALSDRQMATGTGSKRGGPSSDRRPDYWPVWMRIKILPIATEAAQIGVSWSLKCHILDGRWTSVQQIDLRKLAQDRARAAALRWKIERDEPVWNERMGKMTLFVEPQKGLSLSMYDSLMRREAETAAEIGYSGQVAAAEQVLDIEALAG